MKSICKYLIVGAMTLGLSTTLISCSDDDGPVDPYDINYIYLYEPGNTNHQIKYFEDGTFITNVPDVETLIPVKSTKPAPNDMAVSLEIDNSLIEAYNKKNGTDYKALQGVQLVSNTLTIPKGKYVSSDSIKLSFTNKEEFIGTESQSFIIPITISGANGATISEKHLFFLTYNTALKSFGVEQEPFGTIVEDRSVWTVTANGADITADMTDGGYTYAYLNNGSEVIVNLGSKMNVSTIVPTFYGAYYSASSMKVEVSEDGQEYVEVGTANTQYIAAPNIIMYPRNIQYIKMTIGGSAFMIEMYVYTK